MNNYIKKIEKYIASKTSAKPKKQSKGLLAPEKDMPMDKQNIDMDTVTQMAEFVMEIRNKRMELKNAKKS
jgi:uncharacterized membrane protein YjjP (DUF1212 family)